MKLKPVETLVEQDEIKAGAGGWGAPAEPLEVPATSGGGPETKASGAKMEPLM